MPNLKANWLTPSTRSAEEPPAAALSPLPLPHAALQAACQASLLGLPRGNTASQSFVKPLLDKKEKNTIIYNNDNNDNDNDNKDHNNNE